MSKTCVNCGKELPSNVVFCSYCGTQQVDEEKLSEEDRLRRELIEAHETIDAMKKAILGGSLNRDIVKEEIENGIESSVDVEVEEPQENEAIDSQNQTETTLSHGTFSEENVAEPSSHGVNESDANAVKKSRKWIWIGCVGFAVLMTVIFLYAFGKRCGDDYVLAVDNDGCQYGSVESAAPIEKQGKTEMAESSTAQSCVQGKFSVSPTTQVCFAGGNLQFQASTKTWRFAPHQYDRIGADNTNVSSSYSGWIDLFGWGTSGYGGKFPYMTSQYNSDYGDGEYDIDNTSYDWGRYVDVSNNSESNWRTLTSSEWEYLLNKRSNASNKHGHSIVNNVEGLILLPDDWCFSNNTSFSSGSANGYATNIYTLSEWNQMEQDGAVFLPAGGGRYGVEVSGMGKGGGYWSSSSSGGRAKYMFFRTSTMGVRDCGRVNGFCVRLVKNSVVRRELR